MWIAMHPNKRSVYVVDMGDPSSVWAYSVRQFKGQLSPINTVKSLGAGPCHLTVTQDAVLVANYTGGTISILPIRADGGLMDGVVREHGVKVGSGHGGHKRMEMAHPHMILLDPSENFVFVPDLGMNAVYCYSWTGTACSLGESPVITTMHAGCGPRHMCFSQCGNFAYVLGELDNSVTTCSFDAKSGALAPVERCSVLLHGTPHADQGGAAEIVISPGAADDIHRQSTCIIMHIVFFSSQTGPV
jgi:6-phosphogluconolactonase